MGQIFILGLYRLNNSQVEMIFFSCLNPLIYQNNPSDYKD